MQIVIDIGEHNKNVIDRFVNGEGFEVLPTPIVDDVIRAVRNGKPLPKGHGRLIDADYLRDVLLPHNYHGNNKYLVPYADRKGYRLRDREVDGTIINAPTVIEADKEDGE